MIAETFFELVKDPAHWMFEIFSDAIMWAVGILIGAVWVKRHDIKWHGRKRD